MEKFEIKAISKKAKELFVATNIRVERPELKYKIEFNCRGIDEALNQPHKHKAEKNNSILNIINLITNSEYKGSAPDIKDNPMVKCYHYFEIEINNEPSFIVVRELMTNSCIFYSIVDKIRDNVTIT